MPQFNATGQWAIYSMSKTLPTLHGTGSFLGYVHNYLVLVDPNGNPVEEMHGYPEKNFDLEHADRPGNYLRVGMYSPDTFFSPESIKQQSLVTIGSQSDIIAVFNNAFNAVAAALNSKKDLYSGVSVFTSASNVYNSNSVWYTAMLALGISNPALYEGRYENTPRRS